MPEDYLGLFVPRDTFLDWRTFPAKPTDKFNDNICCLCYEPYNDNTHPATLILPYNHVIGRGCLKQLAKSPGGHLCPICRCQLFDPRPTAVEKVDSLIDDVFFALLISWVAISVSAIVVGLIFLWLWCYA